MERFSLREVVDAYVEEKLKTSKTPNPGRLRNILMLFCYGYTIPEIKETLLRKYPNLTGFNISRIIRKNRDQKITEFRKIGLFLREQDLKPDLVLEKVTAMDKLLETPGQELDLRLMSIQDQTMAINVAPEKLEQERTIKVLGAEYHVTPQEAAEGKQPYRVRINKDLTQNMVGQFETQRIEVINEKGEKEQKDFEVGTIKKSHFLSKKRTPKNPNAVTKEPDIEYLPTKK